MWLIGKAQCARGNGWLSQRDAQRQLCNLRWVFGIPQAAILMRNHDGRCPALIYAARWQHAETHRLMRPSKARPNPGQSQPKQAKASQSAGQNRVSTLNLHPR